MIHLSALESFVLSAIKLDTKLLSANPKILICALFVGWLVILNNAV